MTAPLDREAIRQRVEKATSGPWSASHDSVWGADGDCVFEAHHPLDSGEYNDSIFAAFARTDVPALLSALDAADAEIAKSKRDLEWGSELARAEIADLKGIIRDREDICTIQANILAKHHGCGESMEARCRDLYDEKEALRVENERLRNLIDETWDYAGHGTICNTHSRPARPCDCGWYEVSMKLEALHPPAPSAPAEEERTT